MASKLATNGPEDPNGRRRISTRNTKPSAVGASKTRINLLPSRVKNSWLDSERRPPWVSPLAGKVNIRSISEERLSSCAPNLPIPMTAMRCKFPSKSIGSPRSLTRSWCSQFNAASVVASASSESIRVVSVRSANRFKSRQIILTMANRRRRRSATLSASSLPTASTAANTCAVKAPVGSSPTSRFNCSINSG